MTTAPTAPAARHDSLPPGTRLEEFEVRGLVGVGGFGIVYLAHDHLLQRDVALKEYMPTALAARTEGITVSVSSPHNVEAFETGRRSFINEARLLARFNHAALVKVHRFWEANGTAYMVMPYYVGETLRAIVARSGPQSEAWLRAMLGPVMGALEMLHAAGCYHRDIAPDNILVLDDGAPLLLDFGAARRVIGDATQDLTVILKPGYAPIEQYSFGTDGRQGPWTDVYALAAVVRFCATGKAPPASVSRLVEDTMSPISAAAAVPLTPAFATAIDRALAIKPNDRIQSIAEFRTAIGVEPSPPSPQPSAPAATTLGPTQVLASVKPLPARRKWPTWIASGALAVASIAAIAIAVQRFGVAPTPPAQTTTAQTSTQTLTAEAPTAQTPPVHAPVQTQAAQTPSAQTPPVPTTATQTTTATAPAATLAPDTAPRSEARYEPAQALRALAAGAAPTWKVAITQTRPTLRIKRDALQFSVSSSRPGYLYVLMLGSDGKSLRIIFPNELDADPLVKANTPISLPREGWQMLASGPAGVDQFVAIVAPSPREFTNAGAALRHNVNEFDPSRASAAFAAGGNAAFAGAPVKCRLSAEECAQYGAASFTVNEVAE